MKLPVDGTDIHYVVRGTGPVLLVIPGGDGDADTCDALVDRLVDAFTVVTYDRRGMSRSTWDGPVTVPMHTDDVRLLLDAVTDQPAYVFGTSLGGLIGLDLCVRTPDQVRLLVAHEPPLPQVLPSPDEARADQDRIEAVFAADGLDAAMRALVASTGITLADREPGVLLPRPDARRRRNLEHMLGVDTPAARRFRLDIDALAAPVQVGIGAASKDGFPARCARALAERLGRPAIEFPGGHTGYMTHPTAFAEVLRASLI
jgi:pimeloyl-ACP methyl ester carboxylesterase